ncbi:MAG: DUF1194 domain-containing protein [Proteobacteria bacterium]|nr:DUF1194 domain-containing protein [Pseudomonadota bacterium]
MRTVIVALILAALLVAARPAVAQNQVDLALVLAVDASGSVSNSRFALQIKGYAEAFRDPRVLNAIRTGPTQSIAVTMVQWTGPMLQIQVVPWMAISDTATAEAVAFAIENAPRQLFGGGTSISGAIDHAMTLLAASPYKGLKRTIDISGDGSNNRGRSVTIARDEAVAAGVVINGLPILALEIGLDRYYFDQVIGGPGSFVIAAESYEVFGDAVRRKLISEIAGLPPIPRAFSSAAADGSLPRRRQIPKKLVCGDFHAAPGAPACGGEAAGRLNASWAP